MAISKHAVFGSLQGYTNCSATLLSIVNPCSATVVPQCPSHKWRTCIFLRGVCCIHRPAIAKSAGTFTAREDRFAWVEGEATDGCITIGTTIPLVSGSRQLLVRALLDNISEALLNALTVLSLHLHVNSTPSLYSGQFFERVDSPVLAPSCEFNPVIVFGTIAILEQDAQVLRSDAEMYDDRL
ncbi:hypothetical protein EAH_00068120 [Eimeria acervulina]|uniref:Uncharacterized protein n=1 Tax=Eimeria acervulina TaxID=5801 RepID=U6GWU8_EIMAC|nr:hypothetical protein EAH_00068120 [Eimeria acervulina]CDI83004.1 hypothetical protein EAH_00068120 [Eimeria acervulina]